MTGPNSTASSPSVWCATTSFALTAVLPSEWYGCSNLGLFSSSRWDPLLTSGPGWRSRSWSMFLFRFGGCALSLVLVFLLGTWLLMVLFWAALNLLSTWIGMRHLDVMIVCLFYCSFSFSFFSFLFLIFPLWNKTIALACHIDERVFGITVFRFYFYFLFLVGMGRLAKLGLVEPCSREERLGVGSGPSDCGVSLSVWPLVMMILSVYSWAWSLLFWSPLLWHSTLCGGFFLFCFPNRQSMTSFEPLFPTVNF